MASLELGSVAVCSYAYKIIAQEVEARLMPLLAAAADASAVVDLQDVFRRFAFDTICKISFGLDPGCLEHEMPMSKLAGAFNTATRLCAMRGAAAAPLLWRMKRLLNIGSERELKKAIKLVDELAAAMIRERRKLGFTNSHDLLSRFMASAGDAHAVDDKYLHDIVVSFLLAGRDMVSSALTTLFMLLSKNPDVAAAMSVEAGDDSMPALAELQGGPCGPRTTLRSAQPKPIRVAPERITTESLWNESTNHKPILDCNSRETDGRRFTLSRILLRTARVRPSRSDRAQGAANPRGRRTLSSSPRRVDGKRCAVIP